MERYPVNKNDIVKVTIIDLTHEGMGIAKIEGYPLFIENALPKEEVKVQVLKVGNKFGYAKVIEWLKTSDDRVPQTEKNLLRTGIAPLQHMKYAAQLRFKQKQVETVLKKIAKIPDVLVKPTLGMKNPFGYRNKAQIPVRKIENQLTTGFYRKNSHELIPIEDFYIQDPMIDQAILQIRDILRRFHVKPYNEAEHTGNLRQIIIRRGHYSQQMMVILVTRTEKIFKVDQIVEEIVKALPEVVSIIQNIHPDQTNVIMGKAIKIVYGQEFIEDQLLGKRYRISAQSFYQVNSQQAEILYQTAIDFADLKPTDRVIDAYCGIGTIGLSFAEKVQHVYGVDVVKETITDAKINAALNDRTNVTFETGKAETIMKKWRQMNIHPNVLFVDPPRKGLTSSFIQESLAAAPEKIIYISCNPATMARDIQEYLAQGYQLEEVQPVDLFPQTYHIETVSLLVKR